MNKININCQVIVILTESGLNIYNSFHNSLNLPKPINHKKERLYIVGDELQISIWELAYIFGSHLNMGLTEKELPFKNNEIIFIS